MKKRWIGLGLLFSAVIIAVTLIIYFRNNEKMTGEDTSQYVVKVNEIEQLAKLGEMEEMSEKSAELQEELSGVDRMENRNHSLFIVCAVSVICILLILFYVYFSIMKPFYKMENFAKEISKGNFDVPLDYERSNYFGAFTWAFDSMRREIINARSSEREAIENNKTVIATLSHDIKTPVASIRAYSESIEAGLDDTPEKRRKYVDVIMKKCDEVSKLTNDLFLHSLSDLDKLKISCQKFELGAFLKNMVEEMDAENRDIDYVMPDFCAEVYADKNRLMQIMENLINNARKYAKTKIKIYLTMENQNVEIHVRDYGSGIADSDMPFIFDKFYRGSNVKEEQGSGLGLYIVKYLTEKMGGKVLLHSHADGLEAVITMDAEFDMSIRTSE